MLPKYNIYADNAATTKLSPTVLEAMLPWLGEAFGNPSAVYRRGREARKAVETAREQVAALLGAGDPGEIVFTSGGTEADNAAIKGLARLGAAGGKRRLVSSTFEHHAVLHSLRAWEADGYPVTLLPGGRDGLVRLEDVEKSLGEDTAFVSLMYANNEIGTVQPIAEVGALCRERGVMFHTDAVQAAGILPIHVEEECIDLLSLSGHKFHGPKGAGVLYVRRGVNLPPFLDGGKQERGHRAGTENVPAIVGLAAALAEAAAHREERAAYVAGLRDSLLAGLLSLPGVTLNGDREKRLPGNINVAIDGVQGESLLLMLDMAGIAASSASACTSGTAEPSHVLKAIGLSDKAADSSLRLTLSHDNTPADVAGILEALPPLIEKLRTMGGQ
jgi:cysteine desulfurase